ncbi:MAG: FAD-dependent oxidoreductase [Ancalomicrobiaceae bacterium]|nr:FAD-dependent oxidoreductase [Ancalomicrobiaceae bacterium]
MPAAKDHQYYDLVVIGGGPGGLTAAIYGGRARLKTLVIEKSLIGGLATYTNEICNFPGFPDGIGGLELMRQFEKQAKHFGVEFKISPVKAVSLDGDDKTVETFRTVYHAKAVVIATGGKPRLLGVPGEELFLYDKGISFCATCDAASCKDKVVMVIGSGDAAVEEGLFLTKFASKVIMSVIHEEGHMDANAVAQQDAMREPKMEFRWNTVVDHFEGEGRLESVVLKDTRTGELLPEVVDRCFYFIGYLPATDLFRGQVTLDERGYIPTNTRMQTNIEGVFAAGDVRQTCLRQVATAVGDGAIAGFEAERYIAELEVYEKQLMQAELPGMIYVYSPIDQRSRDFLPVVREIERHFAGQVKLSLVDTYKGECLAGRLGAVDTPSLVYTRNGKVVGKTKVLEPQRIEASLRDLIEHEEFELAE